MKIKHIFATVEGGKGVTDAMKEAVAMSVMFETNVLFNFNERKFEVKYQNLLAQVKSLKDLEPDKKEPE